MGEVECHPHADAVVHAQVLVVRVAVDQPINPVAVIIREEALPAFCGERFLGAACGKLRADADDYEEPDIPKRKQENAGDGIDQEPETEAEQSCEPGESDPGAPHWYRRTRVRAAVRAVLSSTTSARWRLMSR